MFKKELSKKIGIRESTIRFYSDIGLLPFKQEGKGLRRKYNLDDVNRAMDKIKTLQAQGLSIDEIKKQ